MAIKTLRASQDSDIYYEFDTESTPLGEGGMGRVYLGYRISKTQGKRKVAIKCIKEELPDSVIERARREASIRLRNDNLIEMIDFIEIEDRDVLGQPVKHYHVVSELLMGCNLDSILDGNTIDQEGQSVPEAEKLLKMYQTNKYMFAQKITSHVLQALIALHGEGYIHRDIDPTNIMITREGKVKLIDFGIAKLVKNLNTTDKATTSVGEFIGKPTYAAPEQILGDVAHQDQTTDLYSVGAMFYHLLMGEPPFKGAHHEVTEAHLHKKFPAGNVPQHASSEIIKRACSKTQNARYQSAISFLADVEKLRAIPYPDAVSPTMKKLLLVGGILAVICVVLLVWKLTSDGDDTATASYSTAVAKLSDPATFDEGMDILRMAADNESPEALDMLGALYISTKPTSGDSPELSTIRKNAAGKIAPDSVMAHNMRQNAMHAEANLARCLNVAEDYIKGIGVEPNQAEAAKYIKMAQELAQGGRETAKVNKMRSLMESTFD